MKTTPMLFKLSLLYTSLLLPGVLIAHTELTMVMPGNEAVLNHAPKALDLTFNEAVHLLKVTVSNSANENVDIGFKPSSELADHYSLSMPALSQGAYTVTWTAMGDDNHRVENKFLFTVDEKASEFMGHMDGKSTQAPQSNNAGHGH